MARRNLCFLNHFLTTRDSSLSQTARHFSIGEADTLFALWINIGTPFGRIGRVKPSKYLTRAAPVVPGKHGVYECVP
jgi:hypothetical protein